MRKEISLDYRPGSLTLHGGPHGLEEEESITMLLVKQESFDAQWDLSLDFQPQHIGEEAGITVWYSKWKYASLSIRGTDHDDAVDPQLRKAERRELVFRRTTAKELAKEVGDFVLSINMKLTSP